MLADKAKLAGSIIDTLVEGKKVSSTAPKEYDESCKMAAMELVRAIEMKDPNKIISAFLALSMEADKYEDQLEED
jgi:hypothetical protein